MKREIVQLTKGMAASDGAGVKMTRIIGTPELPDLDPFLMLDVFKTENPDDYIAGFPPHPHRGFETVTYMLKGQMRHEDHLGNKGLLRAGGVQWMTAGRGIIHSEMPEQTEGEMEGFQLWLNLPAKAKMTTPGYQDYDPEEMAVETWEDGSEIRVITGRTNHGTEGKVKNEYVRPLYLDVQLAAEADFRQKVGKSDTTFLYVIDGILSVGGEQRPVSVGQLAILSPGEEVTLNSTSDKGSRFILVSAKPIKEPIAKGGPFVMNTQEEVRQAFDDFRNNRF